MSPELLRFLAISALVIVTPGQDTALTIRNTLSGGGRAGIGTALGVALGQAAWTLAASAGVTAILRVSAPAFAALRLVGAGYLVFLGGRALRDSWRPDAPASLGAPANELKPPAAFAQGLLSNLSNPKMVAFFTSLLPQFTAPRASFESLLALGLGFCAMTLTWLAAYALVVARLGDVLRRSSIRRGLDALMGAVLVVLGLRLATERR